MCTAALLALAVCLQAAESAPNQPAPGTYAYAYAETLKTGKPLVILFVSESCPACHDARVSVLDLRQRGVLDRVAFAEVDINKQPAVAKSAMAARLVPQWVYFRKSASGGWKFGYTVGAKPTASMLKFFNAALRTD